MLKKTISLLAVLAMLISCFSGIALADGAKYTTETMKDGWIKVVNEGGATLGYSPDSGLELLEVDGYAFKDMNRNGQLDVYEDWRADNNDRAADLAAQLPIETALALLLHPSLTSITDEADDAAVMGMDETLVDLLKQGVRSADTRGESYPASMEAKFTNSIQAEAEKDLYAIPVNISSDPRIATRLSIHMQSLSCLFDMDMIKEYGKLLARSFRSTGVTTMLGPQIDLATEPRWQLTMTLTEDPKLSADIVNALFSGMQSTYDEEGNDLGWGSQSVNAMMKHWVGNSAGEGGREGHSATGKYHVFPGGQFETALVPFIDGGLNLDSATGQAAAVMTTYTVAYSEDEEYGELVGSGFSEYKIDLLRSYGFDGMICTDFGVFSDGGMTYGVEDMTEAERIVKGITAGIDQLGGYGYLDTLLEAYDLLCEEMGAEEAEARIRDSVRRIVRTLIQIDLFENPYLVTAEATQIFNDPEAEEFMNEMRQSAVVMLKNKGNIISENTTGERKKVYVPMVYGNEGGMALLTGAGASWLQRVSLSELDKYFDVVTDTLGEPTGVNASGEPCYTEDDIIRASAEELEGCEFALVIMDGPLRGGGAAMAEDGSVKYVPISLQYGTYTARGENVRDESISGDLIDVELVNLYGTYLGKEKENRSYYGESSTVSNSSEIETVLYCADELPVDMPVVVCINAQNPMVFSEFEDKVDAILLAFENDFMVSIYDMFLPIAAGEFEPRGLLSMQMPKDMDTVEAQYEDVPRDMECYVDSEGNTYDFAYGLNWSGVIQDERVAEYSVAPQVGLLTQPVQ